MSHHIWQNLDSHTSDSPKTCESHGHEIYMSEAKHIWVLSFKKMYLHNNACQQRSDIPVSTPIGVHLTNLEEFERIKRTIS